MRHKNREADIRRKTQTKVISGLLRRVMSGTSPINSNNKVPTSEPGQAKELIFP